MYKGAVPSPFSAGEGEILSFQGRENHPEHSNYTAVLGKIDLIPEGGVVRKRSRGRGRLFGIAGAEVLLEAKRVLPRLLREPEAPFLC